MHNFSLLTDHKVSLR